MNADNWHGGGGGSNNGGYGGGGSSRGGGNGGGGGGGRRRGRRGRGGGGGGGGNGGNRGPNNRGGGAAIANPPRNNNNGGGSGGGGGNQPQQGNRLGTATVDVDGNPLSLPQGAKRFEDLTSIDPQPRLTLEYAGCPAACRLIDLFCPIGRGQRALIVSPPKAGKTTLLKDIATGLLRNHADIEIVVLLIDERPEEVTDFRRTFVNIGQAEREMLARGETALQEAGAPNTAPAAPASKPRVRVIASSNDHTIEKHIDTAITTIERCKRMVEAGKHVVVLLDSITRMGRAFNSSRKHSNSGRTLSGGLDSKALEIPRALFGSARNTEEAGSLTIIASCLVDTGSQADQVIFEEFKGSGNMELILDRKIAERRMFPAINLAESGTRKEHLLMSDAEVKTMTALRRRLLQMHPPQQVEQLLAALKRFPTNAALVGSVQ
ncbi:MAG TPA: transcription termination factor Rho [Phycisphaerales bacterium]|nr:transcription termination factor Rho [Phycisphaerales bacterium]